MFDAMGGSPQVLPLEGLKSGEADEVAAGILSVCSEVAWEPECDGADDQVLVNDFVAAGSVN